MAYFKYQYVVREDGEFTDKDGEVKKRYIRVGEVWKNEDNERKFMKLYGTLYQPEVILWFNSINRSKDDESVSEDKPKAVKKSDEVSQGALESEDEKIDLSQIPF